MRLDMLHQDGRTLFYKASLHGVHQRSIRSRQLHQSPSGWLPFRSLLRRHTTNTHMLRTLLPEHILYQPQLLCVALVLRWIRKTDGLERAMQHHQPPTWDTTWVNNRKTPGFSPSEMTVISIMPITILAFIHPKLANKQTLSALPGPQNTPPHSSPELDHRQAFRT